ncbi:MAG TPA: Asp-tRNA(Asn)/Glu-tRNA(Gln) amidotransferase GatCAB subunit B, partial [bacterium]|nr:Asp-tRNA(Asn)/Glu-tRNA(Gln) amidotransferase GatCAB subunit B [bacterium]
LHTRLWNPEQGITTPMRAKFSGPCVPDPTVPPIVIDAARLAAFRARLPELPAAKRRRFMESFGLLEEEAQWMTAERDLSEYYEAVAKQSSHPRAAAHWIAEQLLPALKEQKLALADNPVDPPRLAALLALVERGEINATAAKEVFDHMFTSQQTPAEIVEQRGLRQMTDASELEALVARLLEANPDAVENLRKGKAQAIGFLVGQAMRESQGKADPKRVREIIAARVGGG